MSTQAICEFCSKTYEPSAYNAHHQRFCTRKGCVEKRKQLRQKKWHNKKYHNDEAFRKAKQQSSREAMGRRRRREARAAANPDSNLCDPTHVIAGLISQLIDENDPEALREHLNSYAHRGRQLSQSIHHPGRSP